MKKFLGAFTAIATTFANQAASVVEHKLLSFNKK